MEITSLNKAIPTGTGNLTSAWLAFAAEPESFDKLDLLALRLDQNLRSRFPSGTLRGLLRDREDELRQDVAILLVQRYLLGNRRLMKATRQGLVVEVENQLTRSISSALLISRRRLCRQLGKDAVLFRQIKEEDAGACRHPVDRKFWALPLHVQRTLALQALHLAVTGKLLAGSNAGIATSMIVENISQAQMARKLGVSRQAVHHRLQPVRQHLWEVIEALEFPLT